MNCSVCLFCGLPGAGKTTLANHLKSLHSGTHQFVHICYDSLILNVKHTKSLDGISAWKAARTSVVNNVRSILKFFKKEIDALLPTFDKNVTKLALEAIFEEVKSCDATKNTVLLIDDNMQYRRMRHEYYRMCAELEIPFSLVYFDIPLQVCLGNNRKRESSIQDTVLEKINMQMEIPGSNSKCKWERFVTILQDINHDTASDQVINLINVSMENPPYISKSETEEEMEKVREINRKNFLHQGDICIRRLISTKIQDCKKLPSSNIPLSQFSKNLTDVKKQTMFLLKEGYMDEEMYIDEDGNLVLDKLEKSIHDLMDLIYLDNNTSNF